MSTIHSYSNTTDSFLADCVVECALYIHLFIIRVTFEPLDIEKLSRGSKVVRIINAYSGEGLGTRLQ